MNIWKPFQAESNKFHFKQIGPLRIWIQRTNSEWLVTSEKTSKDKEIVASDILSKAPDNVTWYRYVIPQDKNQLQLLPSTPDRSIVVKPESELKISSEAEALFFVLIPIWIQITIGRKNEHLLSEIPSQILSNTWFGDPHSGELCYSVKTSARRTLGGLAPRPHQVVCPVYIKNASANNLDFTRLCIRTDFLNIYQGASWLWSNKIHVQFRGEDQVSKIKYDTNKPDFEPIIGLIGKPRSKPQKDFLLKSFDTFKLFSGG